ncbi:S8 family serine peptidase [Methanococcoides sp. FTZ1]|uniref:S8 family serine peptidase n=1 Tax=Methanococcoides sp. FTZ1 TaxID=3439061 RepID=UPI003F82BBE1
MVDTDSYLGDFKPATDAQKKMSSDLVELVNEDKSGQVQVQVPNGFSSANYISRTVDYQISDDLVYVYIYLNPSSDFGTVEPYVWEITGTDSKNNIMVAWVEVSDLEELANIGSVRTIRTVMPPVTREGSVVTEGDSIHRTDIVRADYSQDGSGIKIGVISDGVDSLAISQSTGDLPTNVIVLSNEIGGDEGTAMLEIIHDMAPGAELYFHDMGNDVLAFNSAIDSLVDEGCTVIVDDIGWILEPFFEDGVVASHVAQVIEDNELVYVSSAGNSADNHYQGLYYDNVNSPGQHDFSSGTDTFTDLYVDIEPSASVIVILQWDDEFGSSDNDYDLYLVDYYSDEVLGYSVITQDGNGDPLEGFYYENDGYDTREAKVIVERYSGDAKILELYIYGVSLYTDNLNSDDSIFGHPAVPDVIAVGAISAGDPGNDDIEYFSSQGPVTISYPSEVLRQKPDVVGIDGVSVTGVGFVTPFYGTSASAPHVAAIAAQVWSAYPDMTASDVREVLRSSTVDCGDQGFDYVYGNGLVNALNAYILSDTFDPEVIIDPVTSPTNVTTQTIAGTVTELNLDSVTVNSVDATVTGNSYSATIDLSEGENVITVIATDIAGNVGNNTTSIFVDTVDPEVTIDAVTTPTNVTTQTITGTFIDPNLDSVTVNGVAATVAGDGYSATIDLSEGENVITVIATDIAGNVGNNTTSIFVDTVDPEVTIDAVTTPTNDSTQTITGTFIDLNLDSVTVNGVAATVVVDGYSATIDLSEGENVITVIATDIAGNVGNNTTSIFVDTVDPEVTIDAVTTPTNDSTQTITGTFIDLNLDSVTVNGVAATVVVDGYSATIDLSEGENVITVIATDIAGNVGNNTTSILLDTIDPTISIDSITGTYVVDEVVYTNSTINVNATASGTPGDVNSVEYTLGSVLTNYERSMNAELINGNWTATFDFSSIPDDGHYTLTANTIDNAMNSKSINSDVLILVDRVSPEFSSTVSRYNETHGMVSVISSETIAGCPAVEVNSVAIEVVKNSGNWTGYFQPGTEQMFNVTVKGTDIAGNIGSSISTAFMETIEFTNGSGSFNSSNFGTIITFNTTIDTIGCIIVTESEEPMANLTDDSVGLYFINVELDGSLSENMSGAMIAIPISSVTLFDGISKEDVSIRYYNETEDLWEICPTSIDIVNDEECWITYVDHFSTYGVIVTDTIAPVMDNVSPVSGTIFAKDTTSVDIRFNYSDEQTGINVSSIVFELDDVVIADDSLEITSSYASYNATDLISGSFTALVTVVDNAGNSAVFSTSFSIASDSTTRSGSGGSSGGGGGSGATGESFENIAFKDVKTEDIVFGLDISYLFDEEQNAI